MPGFCLRDFFFLKDGEIEELNATLTLWQFYFKQIFCFSFFSSQYYHTAAKLMNI